MRLTLTSYSPRQTMGIGARIARHLEAGDIVCLFGNLGGGKTVLAGGIAAGLGVKPSVVTSPSFVLVRRYAGKKLAMNHIDLYRLGDIRDIAVLGYEDYLYSDAVSVIEWPQRMGCLLPPEYLKVELAPAHRPTERILKIENIGERYLPVLRDVGFAGRGSASLRVFESGGLTRRLKDSTTRRLNDPRTMKNL